MAKETTQVSVCEGPTWRDDPTVRALDERIAELRAELAKVQADLGDKPSDAVKDATAAYQDLQNQIQEVKMRTPAAQHEEWRTKRDALDQAIRNLETQREAAASSAGLPIWAAFRPTHAAILERVVSLAGDLRKALGEEVEAVQIVKRRAGVAGRPTPIIEKSLGLLHYVDFIERAGEAELAAVKKAMSKAKK